MSNRSQCIRVMSPMAARPSPKRNDMKIAATYYGGKAILTRRYMPLFPEHRVYVEPFGGSGVALLNKPPAPIEVYNDTESGVYAFFSCLRDEALSVDLVRQLKLTPYSREEHAFCSHDCGRPTSIVENARRWFVATQQSYASIFGDSWSASPSKSRAREVVNRVDRLEVVAERLRTVIVEHSDFQTVLRKFDAPDAFHFIDPPYMHSTRSGGGTYVREMSDADHRRLIDCILTLQGAVMLCGYSNPLYDSALRRGWRIKDTSHACTSGNRKQAARRMERIWMNYTLTSSPEGTAA
jgi:DNA adenine methylase